MFPTIKKYCDNLVAGFDEIPLERKALLKKISNYIVLKKQENQSCNLIYICTHNSRRSHFGQVWASVAASYFNIKNVYSFSGGTEATAFNVNARNALSRIGFKINTTTSEKNETYAVSFDEIEAPIICFSKVYDNEINPKNNFAAIMTCSDAEKNCPFIPSVDLRIATTYDDPKTADNTPLESQTYDERCKQIAREVLYAFSNVAC